MTEITPAERSEHKFLKSMVDRLIDEDNRVDPHPNVKNDLWAARKELTKFVSGLREKGVNI